MHFLFHVPFFCTAAAMMAEILTVCLVNKEFRERKKADFEPISHFVQILLVNCQNCLNQLDVNKQSLIRARCSIVTVLTTIFTKSCEKWPKVSLFPDLARFSTAVITAQ
jgi:ribosomal protein S27E